MNSHRAWIKRFFLWANFLLLFHQCVGFTAFTFHRDHHHQTKNQGRLELQHDQDTFTRWFDSPVVKLAARLVRSQLETEETRYKRDSPRPSTTAAPENPFKDRFLDLACSRKGERVLEDLYWRCHVNEREDDALMNDTVLLFQSLCVMGTQVGVKGQPEQLRRRVAHLKSSSNSSSCLDESREQVRSLKYQLDREPATALLAELVRKRNPQGAWDLLVDLGVWTKHEDLALLRSGFPVRFSDKELHAAENLNAPPDVDEVIGIRKDMRSLKVFTIDGPSTNDIDDGLSIERINEDRLRVWIHIADADRWAPRNSSLLDIARQRVTSLYLPSGSIHMFPQRLGTTLMSLKENKDCCALSLGVEITETGAIDPASIIVTPSLIRVTYGLTYDDVDEMLAEGIGYREEWELGTLLDLAVRRREYRIRCGSCEGATPFPIPYAVVSTFPNSSAPDGIGISLGIQAAYNSGQNLSSVVSSTEGGQPQSEEDPVSASYLLVTEHMILASESLGRWQVEMRKKEELSHLSLPFRTQQAPDWNGRSRERNIAKRLLSEFTGGGYCHAWYIRRFLQSARVSELPLPHAGLGLATYVHWTSPIRRFGDLQAHAAVKRYLRRQKVAELRSEGGVVSENVSPSDLGLQSLDVLDRKDGPDAVDGDIDYMEGVGMLGAGRNVQRQSQKYWLFEFVRRHVAEHPSYIYDAIVLGVIDPARNHHAIYLGELGLEHTYSEPGGRLDPGVKLRLRVDTVNPRNGILRFVRIL